MRTILAALMGLLLWPPATRAAGPADDPWTPGEAWAWSQTAAGRVADFDAFCQGASHTAAGIVADDAVWNDPCRAVRGTVVEQMLTWEPWRDSMQHRGLRIAGARIIGGLDLADAHIVDPVSLLRSRIDGNLVLAHAKLDSLLMLDGSRVVGTIDASGLQSDSDVSMADGRTLTADIGPTGGTVVQDRLTLRNVRIRGGLSLNGGQFRKIVDLRSARIDEQIETSGAHFGGLLLAGNMRVGVLSINAAAFDVGAALFGSVVDNLVDTSNSTFGGAGLNLAETRIAGDLFLVNLRGANQVVLSGTHVGGSLEMDGAAIQGPVIGIGTQITGHLSLDQKARLGGAFRLIGARIDGALALSHVTFQGPVDLSSTHVIGDMHLDHTVFADALTLGAIHADGDLDLGGASITGALTASDMQVRHDLVLNDGATVRGDATLFGSHIANSVHMENAVFDRQLMAANLQVGGDLLMSHSTFGADVVLSGVRIGGDLTLGGARLGALDLTGAGIDGTLSVDAGTAWRSPETRQIPGADGKVATVALPQLSLANARVGGLDDAIVRDEPCPTHKRPPENRNGWPTWQTIELDGFTYGHLGASHFGEGDMQHRDACWWRWWLDRTPVFSSQPYVELAAVMAAHGDQDSAAKILYFGRLRETQTAWAGGHYLRWMLLAALDVFTGFGIGTYTFYALGWIVLLTGIGVFLLRRSPAAATHGLWWQVGASLTRLLPGIELNKEFTDFFDDPKRERLRGWHVFVFSSFVVIGWVLGLFLVAAMGGLTQHS